jgi:hypothetical protein
MPGSVKTLADSGPLQTYPFKEFAAYALPYAREAAGSEYSLGGSTRLINTSLSKRRWRVVQRLTAAELAAMWDFYRAHLVQTFNFVDRINDMECRAVFTGTFQETQGANYFYVSVELSEVV